MLTREHSCFGLQPRFFSQNSLLYIIHIYNILSIYYVYIYCVYIECPPIYYVYISYICYTHAQWPPIYYVYIKYIKYTYIMHTFLGLFMLSREHSCFGLQPRFLLQNTLLYIMYICHKLYIHIIYYIYVFVLPHDHSHLGLQSPFLSQNGLLYIIYIYIYICINYI